MHHKLRTAEAHNNFVPIVSRGHQRYRAPVAVLWTPPYCTTPPTMMHPPLNPPACTQYTYVACSSDSYSIFGCDPLPLLTFEGGHSTKRTQYREQVRRNMAGISLANSVQRQLTLLGGSSLTAKYPNPTYDNGIAASHDVHVFAVQIPSYC